MSAPSPATKRACDACHRRKVRCTGQNPCQNCVQASLACTYDKPPQKKGPKGSRAKVITEFRRAQESRTSNTLIGDDGGLAALHLSPPAKPLEPLSLEVIEACISQYFEKMYNTVPILDQAWIHQKRLEMSNSAEAYCVVAALCVYMMVHAGVDGPQLSSPVSPSSTLPRQHPISRGLRLVEEVKRMRIQTDYAENPTTATIVTSFFLSAGLFGLQKYNIAWYYLQEAITFAKIMRIHDEKSYRHERPPSQLDAMNRRLFWLLFVSERAQALHKHRDISFHETLDFPKPDPNPSKDLGVIGLVCLYNLFRIVDSRVSEIWNDLRAENPINWPENMAAWLAQLQRQATDAIPVDAKYTAVQEADIRITQQWLRTIIWQLSTAGRCLSSTATDRSMTIRYPIEIARDLASVTTRLPMEAMDVHGIGMVEKLFDIAYVLVDVIHVLPPEPASGFAASPQDHLSHFLTLVTSLRRGETRFVSLLRNKIRETLPELATSLGLPLNISTNVEPAFSGRSPIGDGSSTTSPYAHSEPFLPPPLCQADSTQSSSASSSYGGVAGLSPIAPAARRFSGPIVRPGPSGGTQSLASAEAGLPAGAGPPLSLPTSASADSMDTDQPPKPYGMPYPPTSGYRGPP